MPSHFAYGEKRSAALARFTLPGVSTRPLLAPPCASLAGADPGAFCPGCCCPLPPWDTLKGGQSLTGCLLLSSPKMLSCSPSDPPLPPFPPLPLPCCRPLGVDLACAAMALATARAFALPGVTAAEVVVASRAKWATPLGLRPTREDFLRMPPAERAEGGVRTIGSGKGAPTAK
jgi:hypothetical protein